mmetsp:Transcript_32982/g.72927  ORF Transcript_32982/g.72927 Transcript_32982/m.72927 type:complete len:204 (+) Transcript_32982:926-1537(+)
MRVFLSPDPGGFEPWPCEMHVAMPACPSSPPAGPRYTGCATAGGAATSLTGAGEECTTSTCALVPVPGALPPLSAWPLLPLLLPASVRAFWLSGRRCCCLPRPARCCRCILRSAPYGSPAILKMKPLRPSTLGAALLLYTVHTSCRGCPSCRSLRSVRDMPAKTVASWDMSALTMKVVGLLTAWPWAAERAVGCSAAGAGGGT